MLLLEPLYESLLKTLHIMVLEKLYVTLPILYVMLLEMLYVTSVETLQITFPGIVTCSDSENIHNFIGNVTRNLKEYVFFFIFKIQSRKPLVTRRRMWIKMTLIWYVKKIINFFEKVHSPAPHEITKKKTVPTFLLTTSCDLPKS